MTDERFFRVAILGERGGTSLGSSIENELFQMGFPTIFFHSSDAFSPGIFQRIIYRINRRPIKLTRFANNLAQVCIEEKISLLITTGICPLTESSTFYMKSKGIEIINWLSDDPWNSAYKNSFLIPTFKNMTAVFSPRRSNMEQLRANGARRVIYLPFAADARFFFPKTYGVLGDIEGDTDLLFVGGADADRRTTLAAIARSTLNIKLYGGYWEKAANYKKFARGLATPGQINLASHSAKVCLILVRRANRDGHVMRSLEAAASGACMLVEYTAEHEALFGADGDCVRYFYTDAEILPKTQELLADPGERHRLRQNVVQMMRANEHTYRARVLEMMRIALPNASPLSG